MIHLYLSMSISAIYPNGITAMPVPRVPQPGQRGGIDDLHQAVGLRNDGGSGEGPKAQPWDPNWCNGMTANDPNGSCSE